MKNSKKLWQTDTDALPLINAYTVGDDYDIDNQLLPYDILGSLAHAQMLLEMKIIKKEELAQIAKGFEDILAHWKQGKFKVRLEDEDVHTALENYLTEHYGEVGKKIHTGRSRNDQALVMVRLYAKEQLKQILNQLEVLEKAFQTQAIKHADVDMPGYTHMQKAMPTTVGKWLGAYADAYADAAKLVSPLQELINQNPLGSASGFGIDAFPLNREVTTKLLGFAKTQENPLYAGLSRGLFESAIINGLSTLMVLSARFASDMLLFTTQEFDFFSLPKEFTTGSSIMPQKRNYDLFEVMRGNCDVYLSYQQQIQSIAAHKVSGYNRDIALTKKPFVLGLRLVDQTLQVLISSAGNLRVNKGKLVAAMSDDLYATTKVYDLVQKGVPFRDAYRQVKKSVNS